MRLLVLGATGRTGKHILDLGLARGHRLTAFVRSPQKIAAGSPSSAAVQDVDHHRGGHAHGFGQ
ncbi:NAD(P)H-binding protein [Sorangium sp. So ce448]|uniref:NAD(P)H-binding protein n=1 Tax=Sorangium sp. So ce448 TaxID=3133314 RepID=UPI003F5FD22D